MVTMTDMRRVIIVIIIVIIIIIIQGHLDRYEEGETASVVGIGWSPTVLQRKHPVQLINIFCDDDVLCGQNLMQLINIFCDDDEYLVSWDFSSKYLCEIFLEGGMDGAHGVDLADGQVGRCLLGDEDVHAVVRLLPDQDHCPGGL